MGCKTKQTKNIWVNCPFKLLVRVCTKIQHYLFHTIPTLWTKKKKVFVFNTIIQTDVSSPDCHYCLGGGVVTERPEASKRVCVCNLNEEMRNGGWGWLLTSWIRDEEPLPPKATLDSFSFLPGPLPWPDWTHVKGKTEITGWDVQRTTFDSC